MHELSTIEFEAIQAIFKDMEDAALKVKPEYVHVLIERSVINYRTGSAKISVSYDTATQRLIEREHRIIDSTLQTHRSPRGRVVGHTWVDETILTRTEERSFERTVPDEWYEPLMDWLDAHNRRERYLKASAELEGLMHPDEPE